MNGAPETNGAVKGWEPLSRGGGLEVETCLSGRMALAVRFHRANRCCCARPTIKGCEQIHLRPPKSRFPTASQSPKKTHFAKMCRRRCSDFW